MFNIFMNGIVKNVNIRMLDRGLTVVTVDGREWKLNKLLFVDDMALLIADSEGKDSC